MDEAQTARGRTWNDLDDAQKIERMRLEVKSMQRRIAELLDTVFLLRDHGHDAQGRVVVPIHAHRSPASGGRIGGADYF